MAVRQFDSVVVVVVFFFFRGMRKKFIYRDQNKREGVGSHK